MTNTPENITAEQRAEAVRLIVDALCRPAEFVTREPGESLREHDARAVLAAFDGHPLLEVRPYHPTVSAFEAADKAVLKHRERADKAEAERDRLAEQRPDLVGLAEIAHAAGVTNAAVANWATRHADFPTPVAVLRCGSVWEWPAVAAWLTEHDMPVHEVTLPASRARRVHALEVMGQPFGWFTNQRRAGEEVSDVAR